MIKVQRITLIVPFEDHNNDSRYWPSEWDWSELTDSVDPVIVVDANPPEDP